MNTEKLEEFFSIFKELAKAKYPEHKFLVRTFTTLYGCYSENPWRVIGITEEALKAFQSNGFNRIPNKKDPIRVERAHINQRAIWVKELFEREWTCAKEWSDFLYENDRTVLATSVENKMSDQKGIPLVIAYEIPDTGEYFPGQFIGCKFRKKVEGELLKSFLTE
jgi:hypothetical protein